jgi:hypothetical protein
MDISEKDFEKTIECTLLSGGPDDCPESFWTGREKPRPYSGYAPGGYRRHKPEDYDRALGFDPGAVIDFIYATQPKEWEKLKTVSGLNPEIQKTQFLPFNQGYNGGAGNQPSWRSSATSYLWERIWARDSVLNLIQHFIQVVEVEDDKGKRTGEKLLIFPLYHQLDAVRRLISDALIKGSGQRYLIQHSAGSFSKQCASLSRPWA